MEVLINKINDQGRRLLSEQLTLYGGHMSVEALQSKISTLYYLEVENFIIGYIQLYPMMFKQREYMALEEIEIFRRYRHCGYGKNVVNSLRKRYPDLLILDIQDYALNFWSKQLDNSYWLELLEDISLDELIKQCMYRGEIITFLKK